MTIVRTIDRYILREMVPPYFLTAVVLLLVLLLQKMFRLSDLVMSKGVTLVSTLKLLVFVMPGFLVITLPMALLVSSLTAFSRMSADSEVTALKASCVSLYSMIRPVFLFALATLVATAATSLVLVPTANTALKAYLFDMVRSRALVGIEPGVFSSTFDGMVIYVDKMESLDRMEGVFISDERSVKEPYTIVAKRGRLIADPQSLNVTLALQDGTIQTLPRDSKTYNMMAFADARLYLDISNSLARKGTPGKAYEDMSTPELIRATRRARAENKPAFAEETELQKRLSIPFACLIFGLIGAPLGIRRSRSGKSAGVAIALFVFLAYYIVLGGATNLSETGTVSPSVAYWVPNSIMAFLSVLFVVKKGQEIDFRIGSRISLAYYRTKERLRSRFGRRRI